MTLALTIIFAFMVFMLILKKCNLLFVGIFSLLIIAAISLGVGYGMALLVMSLIGPILKIILFVAIAIIVIILILGVFSR